MTRPPLVATRWEVPTIEALRMLASSPLPPGGAALPPARTLHRDLYLDTPSGDLRARGAACRLRVTAGDRRTMSLELRDGLRRIAHVEARCRSSDPRESLRERNAVTRRLSGIVDPARLGLHVELEVERVTRVVTRDWLRRPRVALTYDIVTVRREAAVRTLHQVTLRAPAGDPVAATIAGTLAVVPGLRPTGPMVRRAELVLKWMPLVAGRSRDAMAAGHALPAGEPTSIHPELSFLESQRRVLAIADDATTPIAERLRFIGIVAANLDEFFMVRVAGLKLAAPDMAEESTAEWGDVGHQLDAIANAARALVAEHSRVARGCLAALAPHGVRIRAWHDLDAAEQRRMREVYRDDVHAALTPLAMTMSPGHPFPRMPHLTVSIAAVLRDRGGQMPHFAQIEIPEDLPRLLPIGEDGAGFDMIAVEELVRANLGVLYPGIEVEHAHAFRVTRGSMLAIDETRAASLLDAMDDATQARAAETVVRIEVASTMPPILRELVVDELRGQSGTPGIPLSMDDVYEIEGLLDLRALATLPLPANPELRYPPLVPVSVPDTDTPMLDAIRERDVLVHHPFESFDDSVVRFVREAAADVDVTSLRMTLYRVGDNSSIVDALRDAAAEGKQVHAFVELRARFDEARNVKWVRALEKAGVRVAYGLVGLKTHAKAALVVRREGRGLRRYVHVGTGNYNHRTGLAYTDLSLFSCDERLAADVNDLFNSLTGSTSPLERVANGSLVAPAAMLPHLLELIDREAANARAARPAGIRIKVNGLSDSEVVAALEQAAGAGVPVELVVRGICTLRPRAGGNVRVVATVGRFLEHSRIYHFVNGGDPLYYIGSADLRPRNLRRRVELLAPVYDPAARARLDSILSAYIDDAAGWDLQHDGRYARRPASGLPAQELMLRHAAPPPPEDKALPVGLEQIGGLFVV